MPPKRKRDSSHSTGPSSTGLENSSHLVPKKSRGHSSRSTASQSASSSSQHHHQHHHRQNDPVIPQLLFSSKTCVSWFYEYADPESQILGPVGMEKFCEDIGVEPENVVMLAIAWRLEAKNMGFFTLAEWLKGMTGLQCDSVTMLVAKLDSLRSLLDDPVTFKSIYRYSFDFARDPDQRSIDLETARALLTLLLGKHWPLFPHFNQFLDRTKYRCINKDQWFNILEFSRQIEPSLSNYDEDGAWPVLLDEFVDWMRKSQNLS